MEFIYKWNEDDASDYCRKWNVPYENFGERIIKQICVVNKCNNKPIFGLICEDCSKIVNDHNYQNCPCCKNLVIGEQQNCICFTLFENRNLCSWTCGPNHCGLTMTDDVLYCNQCSLLFLKDDGIHEFCNDCKDYVCSDHVHCMECDELVCGSHSHDDLVNLTQQMKLD